MFLEALMYTGFIILLVAIGVVVAIGVMLIFKSFGLAIGILAAVILLFLLILFALWTQYN
ncbi:hypothetical protein BH780_gp151 [Bacillus phage Eldridge]|uniref:Uncharacterized protein n=1 Tax=Bacillus phage Eldridge TaxID=1776293 RepID=A0A0Y0AHX9_9CAUD|nr:hypothetical protein BH780_gp151 [Bacillus phage Eldridge]AMB18734.1 hypothetical protein Eldridge_0154 [Bacillus phage Eldridge]